MFQNKISELKELLDTKFKSLFNLHTQNRVLQVCYEFFFIFYYVLITFVCSFIVALLSFRQPLICQLWCHLPVVIGCSAGGHFKMSLLLDGSELLRLWAIRTVPDFLLAARPKCSLSALSVSFNLQLSFDSFRMWQNCRRDLPFCLKLVFSVFLERVVSFFLFSMIGYLNFSRVDTIKAC